MAVLVLIAFGVLILSSPVRAVTEYRLGGPDGNSWQASLSVDGGGEYVVLDADGAVIRRESVGTSSLATGIDTLIDFSSTNSIRPRYIDPSINMVLLDLDSDENKVPFNFTGGKAEATNLYCPNLAQQNELIRGMFDGDPATAMFRPFTQDPARAPGFGEGFAGRGGNSVIIDLDAAVPVNRIRFYPRLGQADDRLLIDELTEPRAPVEAFGQDSFTANFVAWYELRVADNTPVFRAGLCDAVGVVRGIPWVQANDPALEVLKDTRENLDVVVDLQFPTRSLRWINFRPFPLRNWEIAEFEVYGEGFVEETRLTTQILDFGKPINWGKLRWEADLPEGTRIEIRTRTGQTANPDLYFAENTNGEVREITRKEYIRIDVSGRLPPVYDIENWSFWSPPYDFSAGLRDETLLAQAWRDGTSMLSPGPSRYLQIDIHLISTFAAAPRLDQISLQLAEVPSAQEILGEIWPIAVDSFEPITFSYVVRPIFEPNDGGFDRLEILTPTRVDSVRSVKIDGVEVDLGPFVPQIMDDRIVVAFPALRGEADSFKQVEVTFDTSVLRFGTEFSGWVFSSEDLDGVKQQVQPGNATFRFSGDVLSVLTPLGGDLLLQVSAEPRSFTPNGDGVNDMVTFSFKLRQVISERPLILRIYDLAGALVHELPAMRAASGEFRPQWNGRDASDQLVPPGIYVYELTLEAEELESVVGSFGVAY